MPYTAEISRFHPACVLVLLDRSKVMAGPLGGAAALTRADGAAGAVNRWLYGLILRCARGDTVLDRFHVGVIGYGEAVGEALAGPLVGRTLVPISEVARAPLRIDQSERGAAPIWVEAVAAGGAPLCAALRRAAGHLAVWMADHPDSFPPLIVNVGSGECSDGDPLSEADRVRSLATGDGNVLLLTVHVSGRSDPAIELPDEGAALPGNHARRLFAMSSPLPPVLCQAAREAGFTVGNQPRGFAFNADLTRLISCLSLGTSFPSSNSAAGPRPAAPPPPPPVRPAPRPAPRPDEGTFPLASDRLHDVRCNLGEKLVTYVGVRLAGVTSGLPARDGPLFERWLVLESPGGRKVYVPPQAVVAIEEHPRSEGQ